jgi:glycosyltransferase involved in cell wall biosynthesis
MEYKIYENNLYTNILLYNLEQNTSHKNMETSFNPKVSIIIPAYNAGNYIREAINSALNQTYKNIEIIVVNDGSNDNNVTEEIALSYGDKIRYIKKENGGVSSALNTGIKHMEGDYFAWLSHDDVYFPNNIEEHINYLKNTNESDVITFTGYNVIDEKSHIKLEESIIANLHGFDYKASKIKPYTSLFCGEINGGSVLIPKEVFSKVGLFNEDLRITQEIDMWARIFKNNYKFINIPVITSSIRLHGSQVSVKSINVREESNKKRIEILENLSKEEKELYEGSEYNFLQIIGKYYYNNSLTEMINYIDDKLLKLENGK